MEQHAPWSKLSSLDNKCLKFYNNLQAKDSKLKDRNKYSSIGR